MNPENHYLEINRVAWNNKTEIHIASHFYDHANFLKGKSSLKPIELDLLGDIKGKSILHLQCHFGQDSISLHRLGASVTGVDFSDKAIDEAKKKVPLKRMQRFDSFAAIYTTYHNTLTSPLILYLPVMEPLGGYLI